MLGVVKLVTAVPPVIGEPPEVAAYQSSVAPADAVPARPTVPGPQIAAGVEEVTVGCALTVAVTVVRAADTQPVVRFRASA